ncbi:related to POP7 Nuclear RNase P subunit [Cephalotrichum gorgonifer]|uniref:Related to POP7 Nuclear RNase P subunit n=1 Tax=Cephalotrichum gorgonifer TaxID=2041049 RepID=A0AAE8MTK0_9PEZI|nr:related to POP7 Nuclear RNase P subunit [Cephalotrichum gorgonifer]
MVASTQKLPPISKGSKVHKRPLTRQQQPSSSKSRIIYVSSSSPFVSVVKRVRKRLDKASVGASGPGKKVPLSARIEAMKKADGTAGDGSEVVVIGTGKAVEKVLRVASWFSDEKDCRVELVTKTVGTVDDIVAKGDDGMGDDGMGDESRVRKMSCLEATIRPR